MDNDELPFQPPEPKYVVERHVVKIPITDPHLKDKWELRKYAEKLLEEKLGDEVQLTELKVKKPGPTARAVAKLFKRVPQVKLRSTIKF
jgi:hypothetical protein